MGSQNTASSLQPSVISFLPVNLSQSRSGLLPRHQSACECPLPAHGAVTRLERSSRCLLALHLVWDACNLPWKSNPFGDGMLHKSLGACSHVTLWTWLQVHGCGNTTSIVNPHRHTGLALYDCELRCRQATQLLQTYCSTVVSRRQKPCSVVIDVSSASFQHDRELK